jgi:DNA-binding CsgD family transcriptional regulator
MPTTASPAPAGTLTRAGRLPAHRRLEIARLIHDLGGSRDLRLAPVQTALYDLMTALDAATAAVDELLAERQQQWPDGCPLTGEELTVLRYAASGHTGVEAAAELHLHRDRVDRIRQTVLRRLGVHSVAHAVAIAMAHGWLCPADIDIPGAAA